MDGTEELVVRWTRFLDGDDGNFSGANCVWVTPYEVFSAPDGREWCVGWDQGGDIGLDGYEQCFVLNNFPLLADKLSGKPTFGGNQ